MKRIIHTFLMGLVCTATAIGQPYDLTLNTAESGTQLHQATNSITLAAGYSYTPSGGTMLAEIVNSYGMGFASCIPVIDPSTYSINTSLAVGKTKGELLVNGTANYNLSIDVPKGTSGLQPNINLNYLSNFNDGLLGLGWSIGGLSSISRVGQNLYFETQSQPIKGDLTDKYVLDGNRLIVTSGTYGADNSVYGTEIEDFSKITAKGSSGSGQGPAYFEVRTKSGLICEYGNTSGSKILRDGSCVLTWKINKITDRYGNYISFTYFDSDDEKPILQIDYTGNASLGKSPFARINFRYRVRRDLSTYVYGGKEFTRDLLLDYIEIKKNDQQFKKYEMAYSQVDNYTHLSKVTEYSSQNQPQNPTVFAYSDQTEQLTTSSSFYSSSTSERYYQGDFNGDGRLDMVTLPYKTFYTSSDKWKLYLSNTSGNLVYATEGFLPSDNLIDMVASDFNGDGRADLMLVHHYNSSTSGYDYRLKLSNGSGFTDYNNGNYLTINYTYPYHMYVDCDGDGQLEILGYMPETQNSSASYVLYKLFDQATPFIKVCESTVPSLGTIAKGIIPLSGSTQIVDFNGDGCSDILSLFDNNYKVYEFKGSNKTLIQTQTGTNLKNTNFVNLGDFNGDGTTDIVSLDNRVQGNWYMMNYSKDGFISHTISGFSNFDIYTGNNGMFPIEINGDNKIDLIIWGKGQNNNNTANRINIAINKGNGYEYSLTEFTSSVTFDMAYQTNPNNYFNFGDFNGDGRDEFFYNMSGSQRCFSFALGTPGNLLTDIIDGFGAKTKITYKPMSDVSVYTSNTSSQYPVSNFSSGAQLVRQVDSDDGIDGMFSMTYKYESAKVHLKGKGFLGFLKTTQTNEDTGVSTENNYSFDSPYYYPQLLNSYTKLGSTSVSTLVNIWGISTFTENNRIFPYISSSTQTDNLKSTSVTTSVSYPTPNLYGNATSFSTSYSPGPTETTNYVYGDEKVSDWLIGRPTSITKTSTSGSDSQTYVISRTWMATSNNPDIDQNNTGDTSWWQLNRDYDSFGNLWKEHKASTGLTETHLTYEYDSNDGVNLVKTTDQVGNQTSYTYYPSTGLVNTQTDPFGNVITYNYNSFDQLSSIVPSTGITYSISSNFNVSGGPGNARYYVDKTGNDGSETKVWYDKLGREVRTETRKFGGTLVKVDKYYNSKGELYMYSEPTTGTPAVVNTIGHDSYGRVSQLDPVFGPTTDYSYSYAVTTRTVNGRQYKTTENATGRIVSTEDPGGVIINNHWPNGLLKSTLSPDNLSTSMTYDKNGNRLSISDPSAGNIANTWYGTGQIKTRVNAKNQTTTYTYSPDSKVLLQSFNTPGEGQTSYTYYTNGLVNTITTPDGVIRSYTYELGKVKTITEAVDGLTNVVTYEYDAKGRLSKKYFNGTTEYEQYDYDTNSGYLYRIQFTVAGNTVTVWQITSMDDYNRITQSTIGSTSASQSYDSGTNLLSGISATGVQGYSYSFNGSTGNLTTRTNTLLSLFDNFGYDSNNLDRLTVTTGSAPTVSIGYTTNKNGNILSKSDAGTYSYENTPYAVSKITSGQNISNETQTMNYYSFEKVKDITEGTQRAEFIYNADLQRIRMILKTNGTTTRTKYYFGGSCEREVAGGVTTQFIWIGGDAYSAVAVAKKVGTGAWAVYNIFRDHLGTITHLKNGGTVTEYNFDSWGRRRSANDWSYTMDANDLALFANRGFTGHEYLEDFKLYNMNGRLYDPVVGRFLSPDPYVQDPSFTQNLNRYSYCLNNPLKYIDPTGNKTWFGNFFDWLGEGFNNLGKWWSKNNLPQVGVNVSGNGVVPYAGVQGPGNTTISIGYNLDTRLIGIGNNADGFTNFYYPGKNYDVAAQNAAAEVARVRAQDGAEWRAASNGVAVRDATRISINLTMPGVIHESATDGIWGIGDVIEVGGAIKPNNATPIIGWGITLYNAGSQINNGDYVEATWTIIEGAGGIYSVGAKGLYQLSQTQYMQQGVNQIFYQNYLYNQYQYEITGNYYYRSRALHYNKLMKK